MNLSRTEWTDAQNLLLKLVQTLAPLASTKEKGLQQPLFSFNNRFFKPPVEEGDGPAFRQYNVSLLTTLHSAQKQMVEWIEKIPSAETEVVDQQKGNPKSFQGERGGEVLTLATSAQRLIHQVRNAIQTLATSENLTVPQATPLREVLKRLKPLIDEIIEMATQEEGGAARSTFTPRPPTPNFSREHLIQKGTELPHAEKRLHPTSSPEPHSKQGNRASPVSSKESTSEPRGGEKPLKITVLPKQNPRVVAPLNERIPIPALPFVLQPRTLQPPRKPKKKRKGFWFKEEEDPST